MYVMTYDNSENKYSSIGKKCILVFGNKYSKFGIECSTIDTCISTLEISIENLETSISTLETKGFPSTFLFLDP